MFLFVLAKLLPERHNLYGNSLDFKLKYMRKKILQMTQKKRQSRPSKECKSCIDILILRQYLKKDFFCGEEEKQRRTRRKIFAKGKLIFLWRRRKTKEENTRRRKIFVCGGSRRKRKKIFGEGICLWMPIVLRKKYLSIF